MAAARKNAGMTQAEVMRIVWNVDNNRNHISEIENGNKDLTLTDLLIFQNLYNQSLDYICGLSVEPELDMLEVAHAKHNPYNLVLLDWKMPEMDGIEVAREIRSRYDKETTVIILTALRPEAASVLVSRATWDR